MLKVAGKVCLFFIMGYAVATAQSRAVDSAEIKRVYRPWVTYTHLRLEKLFEKGSTLFGEYGTLLEFRGLESVKQDEYYALNENYSSYLWAGYEHAFTDHWYAGISGKGNFTTRGPGSFFTRINGAHRGQIGKLFFYKEVAFEYLTYSKGNYATKPLDQGRFSPSLGLGRQFKVKGKPLYMGINYRLFVNFFFEKDQYGIYNKRKIDRTKLKAEINYGFLPHWYIGAYYLRDTEYYYALGGTTMSGAAIPDSKINRITEGVGFTLTYLLFKDNADKYITDLPVR